MTDVRICDGPSCDVQVPLNPVNTTVGERIAESFITLESFEHMNYHFHEEFCLNNWVNENTKVRS